MRQAAFPHDKAAMALFPSGAGFGWVIFDGPLAPVDWGVSTLAAKNRGAADKNAACLLRIEKLVRMYRSGTIVLEQFEGTGTRRAPRIRSLYRSIVSLAAVEGIPTRILSRDQIRACFASREAKTRHETAAVVAHYLPEIAGRLPEKRKLWESEKAGAALFNAAALLIAHYANPKEPL